MKYVLLLLVLAPLTGCGAFSRSVASLTGYDTACVDHVKYVQFVSGASVKYSSDGKIEVCN